MNYHCGNLMLKYFSQTRQISHKRQAYILDGYISHLYKRVVQTQFSKNLDHINKAFQLYLAVLVLSLLGANEVLLCS